jgi:CheB methylesterase
MAPKVVVIGTSLGGLRALEIILGGIAKDFESPMAIVQHRSKASKDMLAALLQRHTSLNVKEVEDRDALKSGHIYLAPADYHLLIDNGHCALSLDAPVCYARPAIDILFESAADTYKQDVIAVLLTGSNADGAQGMAQVKKAGGITIVQDPADCENAAMPKAALATTKVDHVLKITDIAACLNRYCQSKQGGANG